MNDADVAGLAITEVVLLAAAEVLLLGTAAVHSLSSGGWIPFSHDYEPRSYDAFIVLGMIACFATSLVAHHASPAVVKVTFVGALFGVIGLGIAYIGYHAQHPLVMIPDGFRGYLEPATPFHEQLALPCFVTLGFIAAMLGVGVVVSSARTSPAVE